MPNQPNSKHPLSLQSFTLIVGIAGLIFSCRLWAKENPPDLFIYDVNVIDIEAGSVIAHQDVLIIDNNIARVMQTGEITPPAGSKIVKASGKFLIPGLWDSHVHVAAQSEWQLPLMLTYGITGVRNMHTTEPEPLKAIARVKNALTAGDYPGPRFIASGPIIDGPSSSAWEQSVIVETASQAESAVKSQFRDGADFIKVYSALSEQSLLNLIKTASSLGLAVDGHMPAAISPAKAVRAGMRTIEHTSGLSAGCSGNEQGVRDKFKVYFAEPLAPFPESQLQFLALLAQQASAYEPAKCQALIQLYSEHRTTVVPTLVNFWAAIHFAQSVDQTDELKFMPKQTREFWRNAAGAPFNQEFINLTKPIYDFSAMLVKLIAQADIKVLAGTDVGNMFLIPGYSLHQELLLLNQNGMSNHAVLKAATRNPAITFGFTDSLGLIVPGYKADMVLLDANPLDDMQAVSKINAVIRNGKLYDRAILDAMLKNIERQHQN